MYNLIDIIWERANLKLKFKESLKDKNIYLISIKKIYKLESNNKEIDINITNYPDGKMINPGQFVLVITNDVINSYDDYFNNVEKYNVISLDSKLISILQDKSRLFKYHGDRCACTVDFQVKNDLAFSININYLIKNYRYKKFLTTKEYNNYLKKLGVLVEDLGIIIINLYYRLVRLFTFRKRKTILFLTQNSDEISTNLRKLFVSVDKHKYRRKIYAFNSFKDSRKNYFVKFINYVREVTMIASSNKIIVDNYTPVLTHLRLTKNTKLAQIWHAGIGFKSVGYARFGLPGTPHPFISCHRRYTHAFVDRKELIPIYKEVFGISEDKIYATGIPRLDNYLNMNEINNKCESLYKMNDKFKTHKVILFSPTYRGNGSLDAYYDYSLIDQEKIYNFCKKNKFIFVVKMHPFIEEKINIKSKYKEYIYDYSNLDINKLIYVSDVMITDYSSCAYEFSMFNRPLIFYRFDKEIYEYLRPIHTLDAFTSNQYEVKDFDNLLKTLEKLKSIKIEDRFKNMIKDNNNDSCKKIMEILEND